MNGPTAAQRRHQAELTRALAQTGFVLPGTLLERHNRCGKPNCRCKQDPPILHGPYYQWTRKVDGKTVTRLLTNQQIERYRDWFANAQKARKLLAELEALTLGIIEKAEGWAQPKETPNPERTKRLKIKLRRSTLTTRRSLPILYN